LNSPTPKPKLNLPLVFLTINLILIYAYIFIVILNYDLAWMVAEKIKTHLWILVNGPHWQWIDFARALNTKVIEIDPNRLSRPLSNLVEVMDAKFRANLWNYIPPHPSLSLQWPFLFIGLPLLLYKFFRNINCQPVIALAGTACYLTSSGFLSPLVMLSHPAKSMVNFFSILSLATITQLYRSVKVTDVSIKNVPHFWWIFVSCFSWAFIAFLSDETGVFLFLILAVVCFPLFIRLKEKSFLLSCFLALPILYLIMIRVLLPWLHNIANHEVIDLSHYRDYPHLSSLFFPNWHDLFINAYLLFGVHPNLRWNFIPFNGHPFLIFLQCSYTLAFISLTGLLAFTVYQKKELSSRIKQILAGSTLLVFYVYFHTFQLSHNVHVWTIFWYGCLFSLIYYTTLTLVLQFIWEEFKGSLFKKILPLVVLIFTVHGLMTSTYLIRIFKNQGWDPGHFYYPLIFSGKINPYQYFDLSKSFQKSRCRHIYTLLYWSKVKQKNIDPSSFSKEMSACSSIINSDPFFNADQAYINIEVDFEFPAGRSFLNDPAYVNGWIHQVGEPE